MIGPFVGKSVLAGVLLASCSGFPAETGSLSKAPVGNPARPAPPAAVSEDRWEGTPLLRSRLWDVAVNRAGVFIAVGTDVDEYSVGKEPLVIWRSEDGISWREVFRRRDVLDPGDASGLAPSNAVVADGLGFAFVGGDCLQRCQPVALYSPDGTSWREVEVPVRLSSLPETAAGRTGGGAVPGRRVILGSPHMTISGAAMIDVAKLGDRLVAVGWAEGGNGQYRTSHAAWISDDGGRRWHQAPEGAFRGGDHDSERDELNRIVSAGDRVVAGGGNRCCHDQSVSKLLVSDDGRAWRTVTLPDPHAVNIDALGGRGVDVHVIGRSGFGQGDDAPVHWRLTGDDSWERLPAPPARGAVVGGPGGLALVQSEGGQIRLFRSPDGHHFRLSRATSPAAGLTVATSGAGSGGSAMLVVGDRLLVYARSDDGNLLFEARVGDD